MQRFHPATLVFGSGIVKTGELDLRHEILKAATVASFDPPDSVIEFNEGDFERVAHDMHTKLGSASPENLNRMLQSFGFRGE